MNELISARLHLKLLVVTPPAQQLMLNAELIADSADDEIDGIT